MTPPTVIVARLQSMNVRRERRSVLVSESRDYTHRVQATGTHHDYLPSEYRPGESFTEEFGPVASFGQEPDR